MLENKKNKPMEKPVSAVMEDYLETIFDLYEAKKVVRVRDIARRLHVKMPTVTSMLKTLRSRGLVHYEKYEYVELTKEGAVIGREMRRRHEILRHFLTDILKIDFQTADEEACKMEHALSAGTLDRLTEFASFIRICPRTGEEWLEHFQEYRCDGRRLDKCLKHGEQFTCDFREKVASLMDQACAENPG